MHFFETMRPFHPGALAGICAQTAFLRCRMPDAQLALHAHRRSQEARLIAPRMISLDRKPGF
jgi:hypothetical protein